MQPPVRRRAKMNISVARYLVRGGVNAGTLVVTLLVIRAIVALASSSTSGGFVRIISKITQPFVWPIARIPGLGDHIIGVFSLADLVTPIIVAVILLLVLGTIAGWEAEGQRQLGN